jgi:cellulose synthase/poly-beta-1,6-N-acetylglucosamine synthase-like glycosyltransferase
MKEPKYTILLPLYKEKEVVIKKLIKSIDSLIYDKNLLQVLILIEEEDISTIAIVSNIKLPDYFDILKIQDIGPKTKARACNYGLRYANGDYLVIYDAEDIPDKDQLIKSVNQ